MHDEIDFVIIWVDGSDPAWQSEHNKYSGNITPDKWNDAWIRYRDWGLLRFWFRGVEKFAPWVRNVFFVTWGHVPEWLDQNHPKLRIVRHDQFIPSEYLPTFSSHTIELNLHRIPGLSEHFVYFNDDMYLTKDVYPEIFFHKGVPCDTAVMLPITLVQNGIRAEINDLYVINRNFLKREVIRKAPQKWFSPKYGRLLLRTLCMMPFRLFGGFYISHLPTSFLKSTFSKVWEQEYEELNQTCLHRFRSSSDVNQWIMEYWQMAENCFFPRSPDVGRYYEGRTSFDEMCDAIRSQKYAMICFNDSLDLDKFEEYQAEVRKAFQSILPIKSKFEKCEDLIDA